GGGGLREEPAHPPAGKDGRMDVVIAFSSRQSHQQKRLRACGSTPWAMMKAGFQDEADVRARVIVQKNERNRPPHPMNQKDIDLVQELEAEEAARRCAWRRTLASMHSRPRRQPTSTIR